MNIFTFLASCCINDLMTDCSLNWPRHRSEWSENMLYLMRQGLKPLIFCHWHINGRSHWGIENPKKFLCCILGFGFCWEPKYFFFLLAWGFFIHFKKLTLHWFFLKKILLSKIQTRWKNWMITCVLTTEINYH